MIGWRLLFVFRLQDLHLLLVGGFQALGDQVLWDELGDGHTAVVKLLPYVVDTLHEDLSLLAFALKFLLQLWSLQELLLEVQLLVEIGLVVVDGGPHIVDPVSKRLEFELRDGYFFDGGMLELIAFISY